MTAARRWAGRLLQVVLVGTALVLAWHELTPHWDQFRIQTAAMEPCWWLVLSSGAAVLAAYALLVHAWRTLVGGWGGAIPFWAAARVWSVGNLARFAPASALVTTGAIGALGRRAGVSPVAAGGSALLGTVINVGAGSLVLLVTGAGLVKGAFPGIPPAVTIAAAILGGSGLLGLPLWIRPALRVVGRVVRRPIDIPQLPQRALWTAVTLNVAAWFLYGLAFLLLARAFFPASGGGWSEYTAVFTFGYLSGWLLILPPAGIGVREWALARASTTLGLLTPVQATIVIVTSRLLLTLLEILPGVAFLARGALSRSSPSTDVPL